ncbi:hypothetical protein AVEN_107616-1 [Araneus ventricosus]|uniref:Uncharacterized protein n=1 Tax=Araneus ventricosus TaxID=182803 RepID=A0A4Y2NM97_ARAVE|nr:hypothetical protein AVEN_107616-1 [Araneus ventricosus]
MLLIGKNAELLLKLLIAIFFDVPDMKINNDQLFDEAVLAQSICSQRGTVEARDYQRYDYLGEEKWLMLFGHLLRITLKQPQSDQDGWHASGLPWDIKTS